MDDDEYVVPSREYNVKEEEEDSGDDERRGGAAGQQQPQPQHPQQQPPPAGPLGGAAPYGVVYASQPYGAPPGGGGPPPVVMAAAPSHAYAGPPPVVMAAAPSHAYAGPPPVVMAASHAYGGPPPPPGAAVYAYSSQPHVGGAPYPLVHHQMAHPSAGSSTALAPTGSFTGPGRSSSSEHLGGGGASSAAPRGPQRVPTYKASAPVRQAMTDVAGSSRLVVQRRGTSCGRRCVPCVFCECCCGQAPPKFSVQTLGGNEVFEVRETHKCCASWLCCRRSFQLHVLRVETGEEVMEVDQPCTCCLQCPMCCDTCRVRADVQSMDEERTGLGRVYATWSCCSPRRVFVRDRVGRRAYTAERPQSCLGATLCCCCTNRTPFSVRVGAGKRDKKTKPAGQIAFTTGLADGSHEHRVDFPANAPPGDKLILLAAAMLLDYTMGV